MQTSYTNTPIQLAKVQGRSMAYRRIGSEQGSTPIIYLNHLAGNIDSCDPTIMDYIARDFTIYSVDYQGIGLSGGRAARSIQEMASQIIQFVQSLGHSKVHLLGLSLGGFVAQAILSQAPHLVESVILAGTGPAGDRGIAKVPAIALSSMLRAAIRRKDPRYYLFFPSTTKGREQAHAFIKRTSANGRQDKPTSISAFCRQLSAIVAWARQEAQDLSHIKHRVWVVNGDNDYMLPTSGSYDLAKRLRGATLTIYEEAGHGAIFQEATLFAQQAVAFYKANDSQLAGRSIN